VLAQAAHEERLTKWRTALASEAANEEAAMEAAMKEAKAQENARLQKELQASLFRSTREVEAEAEAAQVAAAEAAAAEAAAAMAAEFEAAFEAVQATPAAAPARARAPASNTDPAGAPSQMAAVALPGDDAMHALLARPSEADVATLEAMDATTRAQSLGNALYPGVVDLLGPNGLASQARPTQPRATPRRVPSLHCHYAPPLRYTRLLTLRDSVSAPAGLPPVSKRRCLVDVHARVAGDRDVA
jgi:hypothetical protein